MADRYDACIIGSGIGGLTCGAFLARAGMRVAVLEKHGKIGGYAHHFSRHGFAFESGIHSVPMGEKGLIRHLFRLLQIDAAVQTIAHKSMYAFEMPDFSFVVPAERDAIRQSLMDSFPHQRARLSGLLADFDRFYDRIAGPVFSFEEKHQEEDREISAPWRNRSYGEYISSFISDEKLQRVFFSMWPYGATSPDVAPVLFYLMMFGVHYREGSHYVKGGISAIADALASAIASKGGSVFTRSEVTGLSVESGNIRFARCADGREIEAGIFVSNISPYLLHPVLVPEQSRNKLWLRRLDNLRPSHSCVAVYCGLTHSLEPDLASAITFQFNSRDFAAMYRNIADNNLHAGDHLIFLSGATNEAHPTLTLMSFARNSASVTWREDKRRLAEIMLDSAQRRIPDLRNNIQVIEIGSPATFERYTGNTGGALYGFENVKDIYHEAKLPIQTYIPNLFQVGHWGIPGGGLWNVMLNAYTASKVIERACGNRQR
jgi:prolycopene isomerase